MIQIVNKSATVDFSIFTEKSKNILVAAGAFAYLQKRLLEENAYSIDSFREELVKEFKFKESTIDSVLSVLIGNGFVKLCEDSVQNCLTNDPDMSRINGVISKVSRSRVSTPPTQQGKENNNYVLSDFSFHPESPLVEIKEIIINWWNNYKGGAKTQRSWGLQKTEFKKIYEDKSVKHDVEAIRLAIEYAISATENSEGKKKWQAIAYHQWVTYSKEKWIQYKTVKDKTQKSGNGDLVVSESGAWLGQLKIPTHVEN